MNGLLDHLAAFLTDNSWLAGPAFALIAFGESLAVVGIFIPATPILFMIGVLIGNGRIDAASIVLFGMAGAISGYWASWKLGHHLGNRAWQAPALVRHRRGIARARLFFRRWGGISLIVGRYLLGPFQSMLPLVAGVARMNAWRFHRYNIASGILWVMLVLAPGFLVGQGIAIAGLDHNHQDQMIMRLTVASFLVILAGLAAMPRLRGRFAGPAAQK
jgi:membrane protein DedA with SNARE-associated domain